MKLRVKISMNIFCQCKDVHFPYTMYKNIYFPYLRMYIFVTLSIHGDLKLHELLPWKTLKISFVNSEQIAFLFHVDFPNQRL